MEGAGTERVPDAGLDRRAARRRGALLVGLAGGSLAGVLLLLEATPQPPGYHDLADDRALLGIPNFADVSSNLPFAVVGAWGLALVLGRRGRRAGGGPFVEPVERWAYAAAFLGLLLTCIGSGYYHWAPSNETLFWDRLPMTLIFGGLVAAVIGDRVGPRWGVGLLPLLVGVAVAAAVHWHLSERAGAGDLRFYGWVVSFPLVAIATLHLLFPPRYTRSGLVLGACGVFLLARAAEALDRPIFELTGVVSGHTLKHLIAAAGAALVAYMLHVRAPVRGREGAVRASSSPLP